MSRYYRDMVKVIRVIKSCETWAQYCIAHKMAKVFRSKYYKNKYRTATDEIATALRYQDLMIQRHSRGNV